MRTVKSYAELGSDKSLILKSLPFAPGSRVEVSEKIAWGPSISGGNVQIWEGDFSGERGHPLLPCLFQSRLFLSFFMFQGFFHRRFPHHEEDILPNPCDLKVV